MKACSFTIFSFILLSICFPVSAQELNVIYVDTSQKDEPALSLQRPKTLTRQISFGGALTTDGWKVFFNKGWIKELDNRRKGKFYNLRIVQIEFSEHKHAKEVKNTNNAINLGVNDNPKPYIYGKINNFYDLRLGYGLRRMIAGKPEPGNVSIHWIYSGGLSVGMLKPYYIDAYVLKDNSSHYILESIKYDEGHQEFFTKRENIVGSSGWSKGLDEIKFFPGIHAKTGLHFDFSRTSRTILGIEIGLSAAVYTQKIELMASRDARPYVINGYVSFEFGKRYP